MKSPCLEKQLGSPAACLQLTHREGGQLREACPVLSSSVSFIYLPKGRYQTRAPNRTIWRACSNPDCWAPCTASLICISDRCPGNAAAGLGDGGWRALRTLRTAGTQSSQEHHMPSGWARSVPPNNFHSSCCVPWIDSVPFFPQGWVTGPSTQWQQVVAGLTRIC